MASIEQTFWIYRGALASTGLCDKSYSYKLGSQGTHVILSGFTQLYPRKKCSCVDDWQIEWTIAIFRGKVLDYERVLPKEV